MCTIRNDQLRIKNLKKELMKKGWYLLRQGKHEIWTNGVETQSIPRHKEINEFTAKGILRIARTFPRKREK